MKRLIEKLKKFFKLFSLDENILRYIGERESLPEPYNIEEESRQIALLQTDQKEQARNGLVEHNLRLVVYIAKRFENTGVEMDDLVSIGTVGLIKAVNSYDGNKNIKLATFASRCIENEILMYLRKVAKYKMEVSFDEPLNTDNEGNELLLSDVIGTDPEIVYKKIEERVDNEILKNALSKLNNREKEIIEMRFGLNGDDELTQKEVADMLGISQSYISRLEKKIIGRLKKEFIKNN